MYRTFNLQTPPDRLTEYFQASLDPSLRQLRRRAVLTRTDDGQWSLVCCAVQAFPNCRKFLKDVQGGRVEFDDIHLERKGNPSWYIEHLPLKNHCMPCAGVIAGTRFEEKSLGIAQGPLLAPREPYYPDLTEATRDWLAFTVYHRDTDPRNQEIIFLLPELRAYFTNAESRKGMLELTVEGTETNRLTLVVKGAYWQDQALHHFEGEVRAGKANVSVPDHLARLEYVLMDRSGVVYDFQREDRFNHSGLGRKRLDHTALDFVQRVKTACAEGEGVQIEFKPFIDCNRKIGPKSEKTKLRELVTTVAAFANNQGGSIYIGINDECALSDIGPELRRWAEAQISEESANRYCGAVTRTIRDHLDGDVSLRVSHAFIENALVVIVDVGQSAAKPVAVRDDNILYVRAGASNKQVPPGQWESILGRNNLDGGFMLGAG
jgi:hypothetical protein